MDTALSLLHNEKPFFMFQSVVFNEHPLQFYPYETIHIHSNGRGHFVTATSIGGKVKIFDSLNLSPSPELMKQICTFCSPDHEIISMMGKTGQGAQQK